MKQMTLADVAEKMRDLDFCMMTTVDANGEFTSRPMSNNRQVDFDGDCWFFTYQDTQKVHDILTDNPSVSLTFQGEDMLFMHVSGEGSLVTDKEVMKEHWTPSVDRWFPDGLETEGIGMIHVKAKHVHYWQKMNEGFWEA